MHCEGETSYWAEILPADSFKAVLRPEAENSSTFLLSVPEMVKFPNKKSMNVWYAEYKQATPMGWRKLKNLLKTSKEIRPIA